MPEEVAEMTEETESDMSDAFPVEESETMEETVSEDGDEEMSVDEEEAENPTALLPRTALGKGAKEGDTLTLTIVKFHGDDEVEVALKSGSAKKNKTEEPMSADAELDAMDTGGY